MKIFHTADWHLGKLVQGVYMTEDQAYVLEQFIEAIHKEKPDVIIVAGDLYDRAVPPIEAVQLLNDVFEKIVLELKTPVLAIAGNHDSPSRIEFLSSMMKEKGLHISGRYDPSQEPIVLRDIAGEVHFHLVPYCDPSIVQSMFQDESIRTHNDALRRIIQHIEERMDRRARHVFVGHAFVTPQGEEKENTSDSERPLSIGGVEYVNASCFKPFHYVALGHLHKAHNVLTERIHYAGSILKYSISEEHHRKGFLVIDLDENGNVNIEKRALVPKRDMYTVKATIDELFAHSVCEDYVFVQLLDDTPVLSPMEKVRSVYPNAMHVERPFIGAEQTMNKKVGKKRMESDEIALFHAFYEEVTGEKPTEEEVELFADVVDELYRTERETDVIVQAIEK